jgi:nicotinate-nucleotide pyrophosphorylase (carboxylating)
MNTLFVDKLLLDALNEDMPYGDISTNSIIEINSTCTVDLISKDFGIIAGLSIFKRVFELLGDVNVELLKKDGDDIVPNEILASISGKTSNILTGERTALNFLQRLSGVATLTREYVKKLEGTNTMLLDTRKTTPNLRVLEKYAVKIGGGNNHRFNLSDGVMLKDNHIAAAGCIKNAVAYARCNASFVRKIEVEVENLEMVYEALEAKVDIIMLDNMDLETIRESVQIIGNKAITEASGNVKLNNIRDIAQTGVDYISVGAITHSAPILDLSMKNLKIL